MTLKSPCPTQVVTRAGAPPRIVVYHVQCAVGRESWQANLRLHDLADVANVHLPDLPEALVTCGLALFGRDDDDDRDVRGGLMSLESHVITVRDAVRDAVITAVADPDLETRAAIALRRFAASPSSGSDAT